MSLKNVVNAPPTEFSNIVTFTTEGKGYTIPSVDTDPKYMR